MGNLSSIQISKEFKEVLRGEKATEESFEEYIKRLRNKSIEVSIEQIKPSIEVSIDKKCNDSHAHGKIIKRPQTDFEIKPDEETPEIIGHTTSGKEIIKSESHLGEVREIKSNMEIKTIPYDQLKHIEHMKNYG